MWRLLRTAVAMQKGRNLKRGSGGRVHNRHKGPAYIRCVNARNTHAHNTVMTMLGMLAMVVQGDEVCRCCR